jgi:hypothetical protein
LVVKGGVGISGRINVGGKVNIKSTSISNSFETGALVVVGGTGMGGNCHIGGVCYVGSTISPVASTSTNTGTLVVDGGVGINGNVIAQGLVSGTSFLSNAVSLKTNGIAGLRNYTDKAALIAATSGAVNGGTAFPFGAGPVAGDIAMVAGVICFYNGTKWQKPAALADL